MLLLLPMTAAAAVPQDTASGSGVRAASCDGCAEPAFSFNITSGASGGPATGTFSVDMPDVASFTGTVTCLVVTGHTAVFAGVITSGTGIEAEPGLFFVTTIQDNGRPVKGVSPDQMGLVGWGIDIAASPEAACADPASSIGTDWYGLLSGNVVVRDATP
jgi:hypothetical protein